MNKISTSDFDARRDFRYREIAGEMMRLFDISFEEAVNRIDQDLQQVDFDLDEFVYHDLPERWAHRIYWEQGSYWWITAADRAELGLQPLRAKPYLPRISLE